MHGGPEQARLLHGDEPVEYGHGLNGLASLNLDDWPRREHLLQFVRGAQRGKLAGMDDGQSMTVLGLVQIVGGDEHGDALGRKIADHVPESSS